MMEKLNPVIKLARDLVKGIKSTKLSALLLAWLISVVAIVVIIFIVGPILGETAAAWLVVLVIISVIIFMIVLLIKLIPGRSVDLIPVTEISGLVTLHNEGVLGARVRLLTANGADTETDQDGVFRLLSDYAQQEWRIRATYNSPGGTEYGGIINVKPEEVRRKRVLIELKPANDTLEEIIFDKLEKLKTHIDDHRERIEAIVAPLIERNGLDETTQGFNDLVEHHQRWSEPYATYLFGGVNLKEVHLNAENLQIALNNAMTEVESFQACAFLLTYQSFVQKSLLYDAMSLYNTYTNGTSPTESDSLLRSVKGGLIESFETLESDEGRRRVFAHMPLNTANDVREFVKAWCIAWKHKVQAANNHGFLRSAIVDFEAVVYRNPA